jgi:hypothetical protein
MDSNWDKATDWLIDWLSDWLINLYWNLGMLIPNNTTTDLHINSLNHVKICSNFAHVTTMNDP